MGSTSALSANLLSSVGSSTASGTQAHMQAKHPWDVVTHNFNAYKMYLR